MKKNLLFAMVACGILLFSCKKATEETPEEKKYDVTFKVSEFSQSVEDIKKGMSVSAVGDTLKNYTDYLYYRITSLSTYRLVASGQQASAEKNFGIISEKLPSGFYEVSVASSKLPLTFNDNIYPNLGYWDDCFHKKITISVNSSTLNQDIKLDRIVGAIEVKLTDLIPSNADKITITAEGDDTSYDTYKGRSSNSRFNNVKDFVVLDYEKGSNNKRLIMHVINTLTSMNIKIRCYDSKRFLIAEKSVSNVNCFRNKITILTGSLFNNTGNPLVGFNVTVNPVWGECNLNCVK